MATHTPHILPFIVLAFIFFPPHSQYILFLFMYFPFALSLHYTSSLSVRTPFFHHFSATHPLCAAFSMFFFFLFSASDFFTISFSIFSKAIATTRTPSQREEKITRKTLFRYFILQKKIHSIRTEMYCVVLYSMNIEWNDGLKSPTTIGISQ